MYCADGSIFLAAAKSMPAGVAVSLSWLERPVHTRKVGGSTPLAATTMGV